MALSATSAEFTAMERRASLSSSKHGAGQLEEAYGSEDDPRLAFMSDLAQWAEAMSQQGWPTFVRVELGQEDRTEVAVYEGRDETRDYLHATTLLSNISDEELAEGARPRVWVSERVVVGGNEALTARFLEQK